MIPAGCSPERNFRWPIPSTSIRFVRAPMWSKRAAGVARAKSRTLGAMMTANTARNSAQTIGNTR